MKRPENATTSRRSAFAGLYKTLRLRAGLTQVQLAVLLRLSQTAVSERERGAVDIRLSELDGLARLAGTNIAAALASLDGLHSVDEDAVEVSRAAG